MSSHILEGNKLIVDFINKDSSRPISHEGSYFNLANIEGTTPDNFHKWGDMEFNSSFSWITPVWTILDEQVSRLIEKKGIRYSLSGYMFSKLKEYFEHHKASNKTDDAFFILCDTIKLYNSETQS